MISEEINFLCFKRFLNIVPPRNFSHQSDLLVTKVGGTSPRGGFKREKERRERRIREKNQREEREKRERRIIFRHIFDDGDVCLTVRRVVLLVLPCDHLVIFNFFFLLLLLLLLLDF